MQKLSGKMAHANAVQRAAEKNPFDLPAPEARPNVGKREIGMMAQAVKVPIRGIRVEEWPGYEDGMRYWVIGNGEGHITQDGEVRIHWANDHYWFQKKLLAVRLELRRLGLVD